MTCCTPGLRFDITFLRSPARADAGLVGLFFEGKDDRRRSHPLPSHAAIRRPSLAEDHDVAPRPPKTTPPAPALRRPIRRPPLAEDSDAVAVEVSHTPSSSRHLDALASLACLRRSGNALASLAVPSASVDALASLACPRRASTRSLRSRAFGERNASASEDGYSPAKNAVTAAARAAASSTWHELAGRVHREQRRRRRRPCGCRAASP